MLHRLQSVNTARIRFRRPKHTLKSKLGVQKKKSWEENEVFRPSSLWLLGGSVSPGMGRDSWLECRGPDAPWGICCPVTGGSQGSERRGLMSGRGGESWGWGGWHTSVWGCVPILFCLFKNLFWIILGSHCSSGPNRIVKHIQCFPHASLGGITYSHHQRLFAYASLQLLIAAAKR